MFKKTVALIAMLLSAPLAHAGSWTYGHTIANIIVEGEDDGGRTYLLFETTINPDGCAGDYVAATRIYPNTQKGKNLLSVALWAKATGAMLGVFTSGCDDRGRPIVFALWVQ